MRAAARHADAWNCLGGQPYGFGPKPADQDGGRSLGGAVAETRRLSERLDEICGEVGRDPATQSYGFAFARLGAVLLDDLVVSLDRRVQLTWAVEVKRTGNVLRVIRPPVERHDELDRFPMVDLRP
jgi:hypothetical protein